MLILPKPWTRQPQGAVGVDASSPFAVGLIDGFTTAGGAVRRIVSGAQPIRAGATPLPQASFAGDLLAQKLSGSGSHIQLPATNIAGLQIVQYTTIVHITSQNGEMIFEQGATADSNAGFYFYGLTASAVRLQIHNGTGTAFKDVNYTLPNNPTVITVRVDLSASFNTYEIWHDGALQANGVTTRTGGSFLANALNVGSRNAASLRSDGAYGDMFIHNRWMPPGELGEFHRRLFSIYQPRRIYIPTAAAGGVSLNLSASTLALAGTVTASGDIQISEEVTLNLSTDPIALAGTATLAGDLTITPAPTLDLSAATLSLAGSVVAAGDISYTLPFNLAADPVAIAGSVTLAGDILATALPVIASLAPTTIGSTTATPRYSITY